MTFQKHQEILKSLFFPYHLDCDPNRELITQKPAYLTSRDTNDKGQSQLPHLLFLREEPKFLHWKTSQWHLPPLH